jgi:hypothetical protein
MKIQLDSDPRGAQKNAHFQTNALSKINFRVAEVVRLLAPAISHGNPNSHEFGYPKNLHLIERRPERANKLAACRYGRVFTAMS